MSKLNVDIMGHMELQLWEFILLIHITKFDISYLKIEILLSPFWAKLDCCYTPLDHFLYKKVMVFDNFLAADKHK